MLDAGRLLSILCPFGTEVTESGNIGNVIHVDIIRTFGNNLIDSDSYHACRKIVFLLAGYFTGMASGAVFILNK